MGRPASWYAVPCNLDRDPRVRALGRAVGCETVDAYVVRVMSWLKEFARDGQVVGYSEDIADAIRWPFAVDLAGAFADAGLLTEGGVLRDWPSLNGWLVSRAERDRARHRKNPAQPGSVGRTDGRTDGRTGTFSAEPPGSLRGGALHRKKRRDES